MRILAYGVLVACVLLVLYAYLLYPGLLLLLAAWRSKGSAAAATPSSWPAISITVPAYNEERSIAATIERLLELEYPGERQILVVSDASTDGTDDVVRRYADRGVELLRMPVRGGKTAAENEARHHLRGSIIINTDASVRIHPTALPPLIAAFADPSVGVSSGRDVSVAQVAETANVGESGYVGYEMWVRRLETEVSGIVGASGCFYAIRAELHQTLVPSALSRDFSAALVSREHGFRAVSVDAAVCFVARTSSLHAEYRRKVRTVARGIETLYYKRALLNVFQYGMFSWMLFSHKVVRWVTPWAMAASAVVIAWLAIDEWWARGLLAGGLAVALLALIGWNSPQDRPMPRLLALPTFAVSGNVAVMRASLKAMRGELNPIWEPTRRSEVG